MNYEQPFLPNFLEAEAKAREAMISETERQLYLAKQFCRYDKAQKKCSNEFMKKILEKAKSDVIRIMERQ